MERVAIAATKQSLRTHMLELHAPVRVAELAARVRTAPLALLAVAGAPPLAAVLRDQAAGQIDEGTRLLLVGPEGDWTPDELALLVEAGAVPVGLGNLRLRTETAAIALLAGVQQFGH
jgi:16S rRNA (uracil1498-N3)-methyltransferase